MVMCMTAHAQTRQEIITTITLASIAGGVDPDVAIAIATVESGLNPKARGALGEVGVFQLRPEFHNVVPGSPNHNVLIGVAYLVQLKTKFSPKYGDAWFVLFNYGPNKPPKNPRDTKYYRKVTKEIERLKFKKYLAVR